MSVSGRTGRFCLSRTRCRAFSSLKGILRNLLSLDILSSTFHLDLAIETRRQSLALGVGELVLVDNPAFWFVRVMF